MSNCCGTFPEKFSQLLTYSMITLVRGCPGVVDTCVVLQWSLMLACQHVECAQLSACVFIVWKPAGCPAFCSSPLMCLLLNFGLKLCWNPVSLPFGTGDGLNVVEAGVFHCLFFLRNKAGSQPRCCEVKGCWPLWAQAICWEQGRIIEGLWHMISHTCCYLLSAGREVGWVMI